MKYQYPFSEEEENEFLSIGFAQIVLKVSSFMHHFT